MVLDRKFAKMVRRISNGAYDIVGLPKGETAPPFQWRAEAEEWLARNQDRLGLKTRKVGPRPCLRCGGTFDSEGIHHRMCAPCRGRSSYDDATPFSFGAIHGRKRA